METILAVVIVHRWNEQNEIKKKYFSYDGDNLHVTDIFFKFHFFDDNCAVLD